jgi:PAS domain S-box-containing protein
MAPGSAAASAGVHTHLFESSLDGILIETPNGEILDANPAACRLLGYERDELRGMHALDLVPSESRPYIESLMHRSAAGSISRGVLTCVRKDGTRFLCRELSWVTRLDGQELAFVVLDDVTKEREAIDAVAESERLFRAFAESLVEGIVIADARLSCVEHVNGAAARLWGRSSKEIRSDPRHLIRGVHPEDADRVLADVRGSQIFAFGEHPCRIVRPDGDVRHVQLRVFPLREPRGFDDGEPGIGVVAEDDTETRALRARIEVSRRLESLGVLAGGVAHDLNNLLMGVLGNADLALASLPAGAELRPLVDEIRESATSAADLSRQMLSYAGQGVRHVVPLDLNESAAEAVEIHRKAFGDEAAVTLRLAEERVPVMADAAQTRQVLVELLANAEEASAESGDVPVQLETGIERLSAEELERMLVVSDAEPGIHAFARVTDRAAALRRDDLERVFDPFFSTKGVGRGLGLSAVAGIVRAHGGALAVDLDAPRETSITLWLPCRSDLALPEPSGPSVSDDTATDAPDPERGATTVLLVDDEQAVRRVARRMLESLGYEVSEASGGREALEIHERRGEEIGLVVLDLTMPDLDGKATFEVLRSRDADLPILISSGYTEDELGGPGQAGADYGFLHKPYRLGQLKASLDALLRRRPRSGR